MVSRPGGYLQLAYRINNRVESTTGSSSICDLGEWPKEIHNGRLCRFFKMASNRILLEEKHSRAQWTYLQIFQNGFESDIIGGKAQ
jgi:hypothetical protein